MRERRSVAGAAESCGRREVEVECVKILTLSVIYLKGMG